jgi:CBS domain-containing protein
VAKLMRSRTVRCAPDTPIAEAARMMTDAGSSAAIIDLPGGSFGILTDRDLRMRVVAAGISSSSPVSAAMSSPAFTVTPDRLAGEVLFEMLERGFRHAPVVSENGMLVGVVANTDLFAAAPGSVFGARRAIARAAELGELAEVARTLPRLLVELHASEVRSRELGRVRSALLDALIERALELGSRGMDLPPDGLVWVAVGSHARRELTPGSTVTGAVVCSERPPAGWIDAAALALRACGVPGQIEARAPREWALADPTDDLALGVMFDRRPLFGTPREALPSPAEPRRVQLLAGLKAKALAATPPTGFDADAVLDAGGGRHERIDIRVVAVAPITLIGRWAGAAAGMTGGSTPERLEAAAADGVISASDAETLRDAFELAFELRLAHHVAQLAGGEQPDDLVEPATMSPLTRDHLRDVFRAVASVQRRLSE